MVVFIVVVAAVAAAVAVVVVVVIVVVVAVVVTGTSVVAVVAAAVLIAMVIVVVVKGMSMDVTGAIVPEIPRARRLHTVDSRTLRYVSQYFAQAPPYLYTRYPQERQPQPSLRGGSRMICAKTPHPRSLA